MTRRTRSVQISDVIRAAVKLPSGLDVTDQANTARNQANSAFDHANTAYSHAGNAFNHANNSHNQANSAYAQANAAYSAANTKLNSSGGTISGSLIVTGNLFVEGDSTSFNVASLLIEDSEIYLNNNQTTPSLNASIFAERGSSTDTFIRWNESTDKWGWSDDGSTLYSFDDLRSGLATTNTTFGTINTNIGTAYAQANAAYGQANASGNFALSAYGQANAAYAQANSAFTAANNRVLKSGDTMTGSLTLGAGRTVGSGGAFLSSTGLNTDVLANGRTAGVSTGWGTFRIHQEAGNPGLIIAGDASQTAPYFRVQNNAESALLVFTASGSLGVGTSTPIRTFTVAGGMAIAEANGASRGLHWGDSTTGNVPIIISGDATAANSGLNFLTAPFGTAVGINRMRIDANGNVSVNTTSTLAKFQVHYGIGNGGSGLGDYGILLTANTGQATMGVVYDGDGYANFNLGSTISGTTRFWHITKRLAAANHDLHYYYNNGSTFTLLYNFAANGNFGIGTASPSQKLDVTGSIRASSQLISTVATGTAPLAVSSTTAVANLNADLLDGYQGSSFVQRTNSSDQATLWDPYGQYYTAVWGVGNDCNNFVNAGSYHVDNAASNHAAAGNYGYLRVWRHAGSNYLLQEFNSSASPTTTWRRLGQDNGSGTRIWTGWSKYWSDGNDGSGSGLDADLLDGIQGSSFLRSDAAATNTVGLYAPAFYDSNNTAYYSDPAANSILNTQYNYVYFFHGVGSNSGNANHQYAIYQEAGAWAHPYPDLNIAYHTGIKIGAYFGYNGTRFYNNSDFTTQIASVGDGDNNFRSYYNVIAYASDGRLKENLQPITNAIEKVKKITGMTFDWKPMVKDLGFEPSSIHETGVIAQDVESVLPEAVEIAPFDYDWKKPNKSKSGERYLTVKYEKLVPLLIQAIKEQQEQIEELKSLIKEKL